MYEFEWNFRWRINSVFPHWNGDFWIVWIAMIKHKILAAFQLFTISWLNRWSYFCLGETHIFDTPPSFFDIPPSFFDISPLFLWPFHIFVSMGKLCEMLNNVYMSDFKRDHDTKWHFKMHFFIFQMFLGTSKDYLWSLGILWHFKFISCFQCNSWIFFSEVVDFHTIIYKESLRK